MSWIITKVTGLFFFFQKSQCGLVSVESSQITFNDQDQEEDQRGRRPVDREILNLSDVYSALISMHQ